MAGFSTSTDTASDAGKVGGARSKHTNKNDYDYSIKVLLLLICRQFK
ncbi:hypothetical protein ACSTK1_11045 [Vibrio parahaemolyticus]|nr:hypothetical protein [Vibrio parahaemolyticus]ELV8771616.1 hypothetical protein [Vibrio harveyi]EIV8498711.1 hypothetical protein [Vibrio parahaemolyticus]EJG1746724.1 hypothetical protein [Vibrio parahaemolyticus]MBE4328195.1 hypothetical protein [Vibrio parahaemolyticus]MBE4341821.1 hypothetical protein [Vibrio parahaemolyticus]